MNGPLRSSWDLDSKQDTGGQPDEFASVRPVFSSHRFYRSPGAARSRLTPEELDKRWESGTKAQQRFPQNSIDAVVNPVSPEPEFDNGILLTFGSKPDDDIRVKVQRYELLEKIDLGATFPTVVLGPGVYYGAVTFGPYDYDAEVWSLDTDPAGANDDLAVNGTLITPDNTSNYVNGGASINMATVTAGNTFTIDVRNRTTATDEASGFGSVYVLRNRDITLVDQKRNVGWYSSASFFVPFTFQTDDVITISCFDGWAVSYSWTGSNEWKIYLDGYIVWSGTFGTATTGASSTSNPSAYPLGSRYYGNPWLPFAAPNPDGLDVPGLDVGPWFEHYYTIDTITVP